MIFRFISIFLRFHSMRLFSARTRVSMSFILFSIEKLSRMASESIACVNRANLTSSRREKVSCRSIRINRQFHTLFGWSSPHSSFWMHIVSHRVAMIIGDGKKGGELKREREKRNFNGKPADKVDRLHDIPTTTSHHTISTVVNKTLSLFCGFSIFCFFIAFYFPWHFFAFISILFHLFPSVSSIAAPKSHQIEQ